MLRQSIELFTGSVAVHAELLENRLEPGGGCWLFGLLEHPEMLTESNQCSELVVHFNFERAILALADPEIAAAESALSSSLFLS